MEDSFLVCSCSHVCVCQHKAKYILYRCRHTNNAQIHMHPAPPINRESSAFTGSHKCTSSHLITVGSAQGWPWSSSSGDKGWNLLANIEIPSLSQLMDISESPWLCGHVHEKCLDTCACPKETVTLWKVHAGADFLAGLVMPLGTNAGTVCQELQPLGRSHIGDFHRGLSFVGAIRNK